MTFKGKNQHCQTTIFKNNSAYEITAFDKHRLIHKESNLPKTIQLQLATL